MFGDCLGRSERCIAEFSPGVHGLYFFRIPICGLVFGVEEGGAQSAARDESQVEFS